MDCFILCDWLHASVAPNQRHAYAIEATHLFKEKPQEVAYNRVERSSLTSETMVSFAGALALILSTNVAAFAPSASFGVRSNVQVSSICRRLYVLSLLQHPFLTTFYFDYA
jgi:hypothetical protein